MANVKNYITAEEARTLTRTSQKQINIVFRAIREQAEYGINTFTYGVDMLDPTVLSSVILTLEQAGYKVTKIEDESLATPKCIGLEISW